MLKNNRIPQNPLTPLPIRGPKETGPITKPPRKSMAERLIMRRIRAEIQEEKEANDNGDLLGRTSDCEQQS